MTSLRERWEGVCLPGDYHLERWSGGDDAAGFFEAAAGPDGRRAVVKVTPETTGDGAGKLAVWQKTRELRHPNLREMLACGRAEMNGEVVLYAVLEPIDDTLANALAQGALSEAEAREVLDAVLGGLRYLQSQGLAPGALDPAQVVAVGDRIKLTTDGLREPADASFKDELRAFWYKISPSTLGRSADILSQALAQAPAQAFGEGAPGEPIPTQPTLQAPDRKPAHTEVLAMAKGTPLPEAHRAEAAPLFKTETLRTETSAEPSKRFPKWILVGAAGVVLLVLGLNLRRTPDAPPVQHATSVTVPAPAPVAAPKVDSGKKGGPPPSEAGKGGWRVIAFTYKTRAAAAKKAEQVNRRHLDFRATVFSPREKTGYFLVALGGRMTREEAVRVQRKARAERVTNDAYIQNYLD